MEHIINLDEFGYLKLQQNIFPQIESGETILFLGSGISVGEK